MLLGRSVVWICLLLALAACGGEESGQAGSGAEGRRRGGASAAAVPVKVESVARRDISEYILANTTLEAFKWVDVRSRTTGQVEAILKEEGDPVQAGTVLAELDVESARLQVAQMKVAYTDALRTYERDEKMFERKLVSPERYETSKMQMQRTRTQLDQARLNSSYTEITSPVKGVVTIRSVEIGNMVTNNQVVFSVADFDPLLARIRIPEKSIGKVAVGQGARVTVESAPGKDFRGKVTMISPVVNPESGTIKVTIEIPGHGQSILRPGMFASVYIITDTHENSLVIPKKSLILEGEGNQIFVFEPDSASDAGKAIRKKVVLGFEDNEWAEVREGLVDGERVITVGQEGLRPGTAVRLVGAGAVAADTAKPPAENTGARLASGGVPAVSGGAEMTVERMKMMQARIFERFPAAKEAYDSRLKSDPELGTNPQKWQAFVAQLREKGVLPAQGGTRSN